MLSVCGKGLDGWKQSQKDLLGGTIYEALVTHQTFLMFKSVTQDR